MTRMKSIFDNDMVRAWGLAVISVTSTCASWLNLFNAALTTCVLLGTVYLTARKVFGKDKDKS